MGEPLADESGRGYDDNPLGRDFIWAWKDAGIDKVIFHDLRHTFASRKIMQGYSLKAVAEQGGWKSISVLERRYTHLQPEHLEAMMDAPYVEKREDDRREEDTE
jgi:integrase